jgi:hypothetical protein
MTIREFAETLAKDVVNALKRHKLFDKTWRHKDPLTDATEILGDESAYPPPPSNKTDQVLAANGEWITLGSQQSQKKDIKE